MTSSNAHRFLILVITGLLLLTLVTGCKPIAETTQPASNTPEPTNVVTAEPTVVSRKLILADPDGTASPEVISFLTEQAAENGLVFETTAVIDSAALTNGNHVVVFISKPDNLQDLVSALPQTQFIVAANEDPAGMSNLSVIKTQAQDLAFMSGYLTALISEDWRSSGLIPNDTSLGLNYKDAFVNGARYLCGLCVPYWAPLLYFPVVVEASATAGADAWISQFNLLSDNVVYTVFVDPSIALPEVLENLTSSNYTLVGNAGTSTPESFTALLGYDLLPGLKTLLPSALAGTGGQSSNASIKITSYASDGLVTPAKIDAFNKVAADLAAGWINPLSVPDN